MELAERSCLAALADMSLLDQPVKAIVCPTAYVDTLILFDITLTFVKYLTSTRAFLKLALRPLRPLPLTHNLIQVHLHLHF